MGHNAASENWVTVRRQQVLRILYFAWARADGLKADTREKVIPRTGMPLGGASGSPVRAGFPVFAR
jgi:hypothetical protein